MLGSKLGWLITSLISDLHYTFFSNFLINKLLAAGYYYCQLNVLFSLFRNICPDLVCPVVGAI